MDQNFQENVEVPPEDISELYNKIFTDIPIIKNSQDLVSKLQKMHNESDRVIEEFRKILIDFTEMLVKISSNNLLINYKDEIIKTINDHPKKIIDTFIIHGYIENKGTYRKEIIQGNEDFFLDNSYKEFTNEKSGSVDQGVVDRIFQFKTFWAKLDNDSKFIIKTFLLTLCFYSDKRFIIFNRYQEYKNIYKSKYGNIFESFDLIL